ncbi:hypothetical protein Tco_0495736 [Tanacetum coccineum]
MGSKILVVGSHADNLGYQCDWWRIRWQWFSENENTTGVMTFGVLTKIDLMDNGTDAVDWEKNYYISSIAGADNGSSLCGHVKRNSVFPTILQNTVGVLSCLVMLLGFTDQVVPLDEDEENQCICLSSFCKRHSPNRSIERVAPDEQMEPYDYFGRRGRKEPEALAAASLKRVYVENMPYLVGGFCQHDTVANINKNLMLDAESIVSMFDNLATVLVVEENVKSMIHVNPYSPQCIQ